MLIFKYRKTSLAFLLLIVLYLAQIFVVPPDQAALTKYHVSPAQAHLLSLTIAVPFIIIWLIALTGYLRLRAYANSIKKSKDGAGFWLISSGLLLLTLWLPVSALVPGWSAQVYHSHPDATASLVRLTNYISVLILLPAFYLINRGSARLLRLARGTGQSPSQIVTLSFIAFSAVYVFLTLHDPARAVPTATVKTASYYQPDWLIIFTLTIPRLIMWFLGLQAAQNIFLYQQKVKGSIYKASLHKLSQGIAGVVLVTIVLRCIQSLASSLGELSLGLLLIVIYCLLILIAVGYALIAKGTENLKKIEEF